MQIHIPLTTIYATVIINCRSRMDFTLYHYVGSFGRTFFTYTFKHTIYLTKTCHSHLANIKTKKKHVDTD